MHNINIENNIPNIATLLKQASPVFALNLSKKELSLREKKFNINLSETNFMLDNITSLNFNEQVEFLNRILQTYFLRPQDIERENIPEHESIHKLYPKILNLMHELKFTNELLPKNNNFFDIAIVFGAYEITAKQRIMFLRNLLVDKKYKFNKIVFLTGARDLDEREKYLNKIQSKNDKRLDTLRHEKISEYDMVLLLAQEIFTLNLQQNNIKYTKFNTDEILLDSYRQITPSRTRDTYVLSYPDNKNNITFEFLNGPKLQKTGATRPTTASTIEDYIGFLKLKDKLNQNLSICCISSQPHAMQQAMVAYELFPDNFDISIAGAELDKAKITASDMMDNFARFIYQLNLFLTNSNKNKFHQLKPPKL